MGLVCSCCHASSRLEYYHSARIAEMIKKMKSNPVMDKVDSEVEASIVTWSELSSSEIVGDELAADNLEVFQSLQAQYPHGYFREWTEREWELGEKIAEGGQADLYAVWYINREGRRVMEAPRVIKMFKKGLCVQDLQKLLPRSKLVSGDFLSGCYCNVIEGAMLFNGRFAIMMKRKWGDLRKLIDTRMIHNNMHGPTFTYVDTNQCMHEIADGMGALHSSNITHRGLKASIVLVSCRHSAFIQSMDLCLNVI